MRRTNALRSSLIKKLGELGVEERQWPGRDDGFASLLYRGKDIAHFHSNCELDLRLGKDNIKREGLRPLPDSTVHPGRAKSSPWQEIRFASEADVLEVVRLVKLAIQE
jgi:hypothetical protein